MIINKHNVIVLGIAILISSLIFILKDYKTKEDNFSYQSFYESTGWGYDVARNGKLYIHQQFIPVISDKKGFITKDEAEKAARLVIEKLKNNKPPTLTYTEVNKICQPAELNNATNQ